MHVVENNKSRILSLLKVAIENYDSLGSVTLQIDDNVNLTPFVFHMLDKFPLAVDPLLIANVDSEEDKISRALGILSIVVTEPIVGKFLDFGCGEGHVAMETAINKASLSVGYDPVEQGWSRFPSHKKLILTSSWDEVVKNGPYDSILIYDVLDHLKDEDEALKELKNVNSVLDSGGKVFVRCHPWCSRHGTHLYQTPAANKAYLHLCLDDDAISKLGYKQIHTIKLIHPLDTYKRWFSSTGFVQVNVNIMPENIEPFFKQPGISDLIKKHWKNSHFNELASGQQFPEWQLKQQFVDIILRKS